MSIKILIKSSKRTSSSSYLWLVIVLEDIVFFWHSTSDPNAGNNHIVHPENREHELYGQAYKLRATLL